MINIEVGQGILQSGYLKVETISEKLQYILDGLPDRIIRTIGFLNLGV